MTKEETKAYHAAYRVANKEEIRAYHVGWYVKNVEKVKADSEAWGAANPGKVKVSKAKYRAANKEGIKAYDAAYRAANAEKIRASQVKYRVSRQASGETLEKDRMRKYGVSPDCFQLMLAVQKNACGICKEIFSKQPHVDHCHKTGEVRGLLCGSCNRALGLLKDSQDLLESAKEYLRG